MPTPEQAEILAAIERHLNDYLGTLDAMLRRNNLGGVGFRMEYKIGEGPELYDVEFRREAPTTISPPTRKL
jgi:hypothetical protein